jgi:tetratricopeptide (TPR) repeat protein
MDDLARAALAEGEEEKALPMLRSAAEATASARLWQWTGLLQRSLDQHDQALASLQRAAEIDRADASIAHGRARIALEAGIPAVELFEAALRLSPADGEVLLGYAAALLAAGRGDEAEARLDEILTRSPMWFQGHAQLAQLRATLGKRHLVTASIERAIASNPRSDALWTALFGILLSAQDFQGLDEAVKRARRMSAPEPTLLSYEAIAAAELGEHDRADRLFALMPQRERTSTAIWRIRHLLRSGRGADAVEVIDGELQGDRAAAAWPYASIAWRLTGDVRWEWLEGDLDRLVSVIDLTSELSEVDRLAQTLRDLHRGKGEYLDQSVRGGTQTDGPLFTRIDAHIRGLRSVIVGAVERYLRELPAPDPTHPLLGRRRDRPVRFSGSWSVRLRSGGHHSNHVHPEGWISSAFYVALPARSPGEAERAGWLTLGEPQKELGLDLPPFRYVEPRVGQLVLFPSWMWHGTVPFEHGERMTVAFDVRPPS